MNKKIANRMLQAAGEFHACALFVKLVLGGLEPSEETKDVAFAAVDGSADEIMRECPFLGVEGTITLAECRTLFLVIARMVIAKLEAA